LQQSLGLLLLRQGCSNRWDCCHEQRVAAVAGTAVTSTTVAVNIGVADANTKVSTIGGLAVTNTKVTSVTGIADTSIAAEADLCRY